VKSITVGIVDYGVGNLNSVHHALRTLGFRSLIGSDPKTLDTADLLLLPGVGAFPTAMKALDRLHLTDYLRATARAGRPILGICLGMQLLADASTEHEHTIGLGLIPGQVRALSLAARHIGWNDIIPNCHDPLFHHAYHKQRCTVYFNHSFVLDTKREYCIFTAQASEPIVAVVRKDMTVGFQFHPEKSQDAGHRLLSDVIKGLYHA